MSNEGLRILIVDDEAPARRKTRRFLDRCPTPKVILEAGSGPEALALLQEGGIDLVFLDIQMPGMSGFDVIRSLGTEAMPPVVFVTAWDQYAVDAFAVEAVDYLLKPFDFDRFQQAFERASRAIRAPEVEAARLVRLLEGLRRDEAPLARLLVRSGESLIFVKVTDVQALAAADKLVEVLTDRKVGTVRETLSSLEEQLPRDRFVRVHRSWLVNLDAVAEVTPWAHGDYVIRLRSGRTVPLSRRYAANVLPG